MPAFMPRATPVSARDALLRVLGASVEVLKAENEMLRRRLAAAETRAAQEVAKRTGRSPVRRSCGSGRGRPPLATAARGISAATRWRPSGSGRGGGGWRAEPRETNPLTKYFIRYIVSISPLPFVFWSQPASGNAPVREWLLSLEKKTGGNGLCDEHGSNRLASRNAVVSADGRRAA